MPTGLEGVRKRIARPRRIPIPPSQREKHEALKGLSDCRGWEGGLGTNGQGGNRLRPKTPALSPRP